MSLPTSVLVTKTMPSSASRFTRRSTTLLSSFMLGMPYINNPPMRSARSKTVTLCPAWLSRSAQASPAGPEPTTATVLPVRLSGGWGWIQPSSNPFSMMACSMDLIATGAVTNAAVHEPSHGAGQTLPVNSGKLLVFIKRSSACFHNPR